MPEGVEVKQVRDLIAPHLEGKTIKYTQLISGRYLKVAPSLLPLHEVCNVLVKKVQCKGKLLVFYVNNFAILSTLGMSGFWVPGKVEKHARIIFHMQDETICTFADTRNFGTFKIVTLQEAEKKLETLGPDILSNDPNGYELFVQRMWKYGQKQILATALLDQRIACGSGNYIRADAMYLAKLNPSMRVEDMSTGQFFMIWCTLQRVAFSALSNIHPVDKDEPFGNVAYNRKKGYCGGIIEKFQDKLGRTVWWSPSYQGAAV
jgi:formamidopyrimidine-DNA glycosylase